MRLSLAAHVILLLLMILFSDATPHSLGHCPICSTAEITRYDLRGMGLQCLDVEIICQCQAGHRWGYDRDLEYVRYPDRIKDIHSLTWEDREMYQD